MLNHRIAKGHEIPKLWPTNILEKKKSGFLQASETLDFPKTIGRRLLQFPTVI